MAEAALGTVRKVLQEFPAAARGEWRQRQDGVERAWGTGAQDVCSRVAYWRPHIFVCQSPFSS